MQQSVFWKRIRLWDKKEKFDGVSPLLLTTQAREIGRERNKNWAGIKFFLSLHFIFPFFSSQCFFLLKGWDADVAAAGGDGEDDNDEDDEDGGGDGGDGEDGGGDGGDGEDDNDEDDEDGGGDGGDEWWFRLWFIWKIILMVMMMEIMIIYRLIVVIIIGTASSFSWNLMQSLGYLWVIEARSVNAPQLQQQQQQQQQQLPQQQQTFLKFVWLKNMICLFLK